MGRRGLHHRGMEGAGLEEEVGEVVGMRRVLAYMVVVVEEGLEEVVGIRKVPACMVVAVEGGVEGEVVVEVEVGEVVHGFGQRIVILPLAWA